MAFPTSPTNGQRYTSASGTIYEYQSSDDSWIKIAIAPTTGGLSWSKIIAGETAVNDKGYLLAASSNLTLTLPASPSEGDTVGVCDANGTATTYTLTVARNGSKIQSVDSDLIIDTDRSGFILVYVDSTQGWVITSEITGGSSGSPLLHVSHQVADGNDGGTFTSGSYQTRPITTVQTNEIAGASLSSNQITLPAGTYYIDGFALAYKVNSNRVKLYDVTNTADVITGVNTYSYDSDIDMTPAFLRGNFTLTATTVLEIQHRCQTTQATNGMGFNMSGMSDPERYAEFSIWKVGD